MSGVDTKDVDALRKFLIREKKKYIQFLWLLGDSTTDSKVCCTYKKKGNKGRPRKKVLGRKVERHIHLFILTIEDSCFLELGLKDVQHFLKKQRKKKKHLKQYKTTSIQGMCYCKYIARQSDHLYRCSNYNWDYFLADEYAE